MAERAYPEDLAYINKTKYYHAFIERYKFGEKFTKGKIVLDVPCGSGWGTSLIDNANVVYGIDISIDAIQYARSHFNGVFSQGSMCRLNFKDNKFDIALSFEGMEHITKEEGVLFINEIKRVVKKDGLVVGSVPILDENGESTGNPYHKFEYPEDYLQILLESNFKIIEYINKKGGDGPIVYFVLKNSLKHVETVLVSAYNGAKDVKEAISTLNQNSSNFNLIIINDISAGIIGEVLQNTNSLRIKIVNYKFIKKTDFDKKLLRKPYSKELKKMSNLIVSILPNPIVKVLKGIKHILKA